MKKGIITALILTLGVVTALLLSTTCLIGCGSDDDVTKGDVAEEPPEPPVEQEPEKSSLERAKELVKKVGDILHALRQEGKPDEEHFKAVNALYEKEYGFGPDFLIVLYKIHTEENPAEGDLNTFAPDPLLIEYFRISFEFPDLPENELLQKFRGSSREGNISINLDNPKPEPLKPEESNE